MTTLRAILNDLDAVTPDEWGAQGNYGYPDYSDRITTVFVHYNGGPVSDAANAGDPAAERETLRHDEAYHLRNGYHALAYDAAIGQSGILYEARAEDRSGATGGDLDLDGIPNNTEAEAILLIIGAGQTPSAAMLRTLKRVLDRLALPVYGHRESAQRGTGTVTACPGDPAMEWVRRYRTDEWKDTEDVLQTGDNGANVIAWQHRLKEVIGIDLTVDGNFGPETEAATKEFQGLPYIGLEQSGRVTAADWHLLGVVEMQQYVKDRVNEATEGLTSDDSVPEHRHREVPEHSHRATVTLT